MKSSSFVTQIKTSEQYLPVVLTVYYVVQGGFNWVCGLNPNIKSLTIPLKLNEQYFLVVLLIMLYKMLLTFESVDKIIKCAL